jgi:hypothetical protein
VRDRSIATPRADVLTTSGLMYASFDLISLLREGHGRRSVVYQQSDDWHNDPRGSSLACSRIDIACGPRLTEHLPRASVTVRHPSWAREDACYGRKASKTAGACRKSVLRLVWSENEPLSGHSHVTIA